MFTITCRCCCHQPAFAFLLHPWTPKTNTAIQIPDVVVIAAIVVSVSASPPNNIVWGSLFPHCIRNLSSQTNGQKENCMIVIFRCCSESWCRKIYIRRNSVFPFPPLEQIYFPGPYSITPTKLPNPSPLLWPHLKKILYRHFLWLYLLLSLSISRPSSSINVALEITCPCPPPPPYPSRWGEVCRTH